MVLSYIDSSVLSDEFAKTIQNSVQKLNIIFMISVMYKTLFNLTRCEIAVNPKFQTPVQVMNQLKRLRKIKWAYLITVVLTGLFQFLIFTFMPSFATHDLLTLKLIATPFALIFILTNLYLLFYFTRMARFFLNTLSLIMSVRTWLFYFMMLILIVDLVLAINSDFLFCLISLLALKHGYSMQ